MKIFWNQKAIQFYIACIALGIIYYISYLMLKGTGVTRTFRFVILMLFFIVLTSSSRKVFWSIVVPMIFVYAAYIPIGLTYGSLTYDFFISGISTDVQETKEFIHQIPYKNFLYSLFLIAGIFLYKYLVCKFNIEFYKNKTFLLCAVFIMLSTQAPAIFPKQIKANIITFYNEYKALQSLKKDGLWENVQLTNSQYDNYVLIIGESARKDYHHAYGYPVENTSFMSSHNGILVNGLTAGGTSTVPSLRAMLTQDIEKSWQGDYSYTLIDLINKAGINTYWLSNQGYFGQFDTPISALASISKNTFFARYGSYDQNKNKDTILLKELETTLQKKTKNPKFIVMHLYGSHPDACQRVEKEDLLIKNIDPYYSYLNCYISSINNTDILLADIFSLLEKNELDKKQSFSMIYFSDHGQAHREINNVLYFNNNKVSKLHYDIPLFKVSSDDSNRQVCDSFKSGLNFTNGIANWLGITAKQLDNRYSLFDCQNDPNDYGLQNSINNIQDEADPAIDLMHLPLIINDTKEIFTKFEQQKTLVATHRVNIKNKLLELLNKDIYNIEIDIFVENNELRIGHEKATESGLSLAEYLKEIYEINPNFNFIWLDLKDLNLENEELIFTTLQKLDGQFNLKNRVLIESRYIDALTRFNQAGWQTGYYLRYNINEQPDSYLLQVIDDLNRVGTSAITFDCTHIKFVEENFLGSTLDNGNHISLNCWTFKQNNYTNKDFDKLKNVDRLLISVSTKHNL